MKATANILQRLDALTWVSIAFAVATFVLLVVAMVIPPRGQIHPSILQGAAIVTANVALIIFAHAIGTGKKATFRHGNTTAVVGDDEPAADPAEVA